MTAWMGLDAVIASLRQLVRDAPVDLPLRERSAFVAASYWGGFDALEPAMINCAGLCTFFGFSTEKPCSAQQKRAGGTGRWGSAGADLCRGSGFS